MLVESLHGWNGVKRSAASLRVTTLIHDFGPDLLAGIYGVSQVQNPHPCLYELMEQQYTFIHLYA